jgi:PPOX class probable F420-dependent enzyme
LRARAYGGRVNQIEMRRRAEVARVGHLATVDGTGRPHLVPVCFVVIAEAAYSAVDQKPKRDITLRRIANIQATGQACLLVDYYSEEWTALWWVRMDGRGRVVRAEAEAERALAGLAAKYHQYAVTPPTGPIIAVDIHTWRGWSAS